MAKKVVFISMPMRGLSDEHIREELLRAQNRYVHLTVGDWTHAAGIVFVHNFLPDEPQYRSKQAPKNLTDEQQGLWYLGGAIRLLSNCDEAFFYGDWQNARGCRAEHFVCRQYGIPITEDR